jgi:hypothetical protein
MQDTLKTKIRIKIIISILLILTTILMLAGPLITSEFMSNSFFRKSSAAPILSCSPNETLSGNLCLTSRASNPIFELKCEPGYTAAESACIQSTPKTCADYNNAINAEEGYCKYDPTITLYDGQILDYDGRICRINGTTEMWFLRYSVTPLADGATSGPIVCANIFMTSIVGGTLAAPNFRFIPANVTSIHNYVNTQTGSTLSPCPEGYGNYQINQCSRPAVTNGCNAGGEAATISGSIITCSVCPAGQFCQTTSNISNQSFCSNGGVLTDIPGVNTQRCLKAGLKYTYTSYRDGCAVGYVTVGQTCAVKQRRDRDIDTCSYFFASSNVFQLAVETPPGSGICSTGGSTDFANNEILKTDDNLTCAGPGSGWYNYNVAFDPLVCGYNTYNPNDKAAFRWSVETYTKITEIQKLPTISTKCPGGWTEVSTLSQDCYQDPVNLVIRTGSVCTANFYCPEGTTDPKPCPTNYISEAGSSLLSDCKLRDCTNGATNPPNCNNQISSSSTPVSSSLASSSVLSSSKLSLSSSSSSLIISSSSSVLSSSTPSSSSLASSSVLSSSKLSSSSMISSSVLSSSTTVSSSLASSSILSSSKLSSSSMISSSVLSSSKSSLSSSSSSLIISSSSSTQSSSSSTSSVSSCNSAQPGYYISGSVCLPCQAGYYCPGVKIAPIICPIGYYCPAVSISSTVCPQGKTTKVEGAKDITECIAIPIVAAATILRSGGNQIILNIIVIFTIILILYSYYRLTKTKNFPGWK